MSILLVERRTVLLSNIFAVDCQVLLTEKTVHPVSVKKEHPNVFLTNPTRHRSRSVDPSPVVNVQIHRGFAEDSSGTF